jgi:hypothetical protein
MARTLERQGVKAYPGYVARFETGDRVPGLLTIGVYARLAGISTDKLIIDELELPAKYK